MDLSHAEISEVTGVSEIAIATRLTRIRERKDSKQGGRHRMNGQDELRELWKNQPSCGMTRGEDILTIVQNRIRRFDRIIAARNVVECVAAAAVGVFFVVSAVRLPTAIMKTGALVIAPGAAWIIFLYSSIREVVGQRRSQPEP
jgi:Na+/melibiose symporter-like transporter